MNVTQDEARESLEAIRQMQARTRRTLGQGAGPYHMMIWGAVWFLGYLGSQFLNEEVAGIVWMGLVVPGMVASALVGGTIYKRVRRLYQDAQVGLFWLALLAYSSLIVVLTGIASKPILMSFIIALFAMLGYVVMGIWLWAPLAWIGLAVTAIGTVSYLLIPSYFCLIMAIMGGGTLFFGGIYIRRNWR